MEPVPLRIRLLGGLALDGVEDRELGSRKGRTLLKVVALGRGAPVPVDRLADVLWGDTPPARPADQVGVLVSRLRRVVGAERLVRRAGGYALAADWLDVDELAERVDEAAAALADGRLGAARAAAHAALALARGPLLADEDGDWVVAERASVDATVQHARRLAVQAAARAGDHDAAGALAEGALAHDPYDEVALGALMEAHLAAGRAASALGAYARVRARMVEDLGVGPGPAVEALHDRALGLGLGEGAAPAAAPSVPAERVGAAVGRDAELAALDALLGGTTAGPPVQLVGPAGIGKSTLVEAWTDRATRRGSVVLTGRADELGRDLPLQPVIDALARQLAAREPAEVDEVLGADVGVLAPLLGLGPGLGVGVGDIATLVGDPEHGRLRLYAALLAAVERCGRGRPTTLVVEDLQGAAASTLAWLAFAGRRSPRVRVLVTSRPEGPRLPGAAVVEVGPVGLDAARLLVGPERAEALHRRSGGHPLLLVALAAAPDDGVPADVVEAVASWVAALGAAGPTIASAAVLGAQVDLDLLAEVLDAPVVGLLEHLEVAAAVGLLVESGEGFAFRHALVREALQATTSGARRTLLHRRAAQALDDRPGADPLAVAVHARLGGDTALAARAFVAAADVAIRRFELDAALDHLEAALAFGPSAAASTARARVRMARFDLAGADDDVRVALAVERHPATLEVAAWVAYYARRYDDARAYADEGVARAGDVGVRASCLAVGARARHGTGELAEAVGRLESAAGPDVPAPIRGLAQVWLAQARLHQGRAEEAVRAADDALRVPEDLAHPFAELHGRFARVLALGHLGRGADALVACDQLDAAIRRRGQVGDRFHGVAANLRGWALRWTGQLEEADDRNRAGVEATYGTEAMLEAHYVALLDLADGRLLVGDPAGAAGYEQALAPVDSWQGTMAWYQRHRLGVLRARLALLDGDPDLACELASGVADDARRRGARRHELVARAVLGLAGGAPPEQLEEVVDGLGPCAGLDGWKVVADLAAHFGSDRWRAEADRRAAALVARSGDGADHARRLVARVLG